MSRRIDSIAIGLTVIGAAAAVALFGWRATVKANLAAANHAARIAAERDDVLAVYRASARFVECDREWKQLTDADFAREKNLLAQLQAGLPGTPAVKTEAAALDARTGEDIRSGGAECARLQDQATAATAILNQQFPGVQEQIERHQMATLARLGITATDLRKAGVSESEIARSFAKAGGGG